MAAGFAALARVFLADVARGFRKRDHLGEFRLVRGQAQKACFHIGFQPAAVEGFAHGLGTDLILECARHNQAGRTAVLENSGGKLFCIHIKLGSFGLLLVQEIRSLQAQVFQEVGL